MGTARALSGLMNGEFMQVRATSLDEFLKASSALLPIYAGCAVTIVALYGILRLLGAGKDKSKRS